MAFGSSKTKHEGSARSYALEAQRLARKAVKAARGGICVSALTHYYEAQQHFGAATGELYHLDSGRMPEHGRAQRWISAATKAMRLRCLKTRR